MRSRSAASVPGLVLAIVLALVSAQPGHAASAPTPEQVRAATEAVYQDPDLHALKLERRLRFKSDDEPPRERDDAQWLIDLARWLAETGRWLVWLLGAIAVALLALYLRRWIALRGEGAGARALVLPSHVQDLDIRPQSLPDDIGGAVRTLWQRGDTRAALSLLYRGALSRLVHDYAVPVRAASTEGECSALAQQQLGAESSAFFARLVGLWQLAVYGARVPDADAVLRVCDEFEARLPRRAPAAAPAKARS